MLSQDIRRGFLNYFKERSHAVVASSPVVPHDDPTLLFINAGMNQFKDVFLGKSQRDYKCATTSQKCIRVGGKHNDLDNVGHTTRHLTFFEMLGNFSFGDYFKEQAIAYAWEVSTKVFGFSPEDLWITVFQNDDEAFALWEKHVSPNRIVRLGEKDNFWAMGETGPCGPCSELMFDRGAKYGDARSPKEDVSGERYLEFWNLVFMQYNRDASGKLDPLPKQSIDTGSGLERVVSLKMGVDTVFATDILGSLIAKTEEISGKKYTKDNAPAFHVIADHIRSLSFAIADGVQPSNIDRGYVLRKLLRRAVRYGRMLGMQDPFLAKILPRLIEIMGPDYHELVTSKGRIEEIVTLEEESFIRTLKRGGNILNNIIDKAQKSTNKEITGEEAFKLKDTYGLPVEEILLIAKDTHLSVNLDAYQLLEEQAKEKSRSSKQVHAQMAEESLFKSYVEKNGPCQFTGFEKLEGDGTVMALIVDGKFVDTISEGQEGMVLLNTSPFYAEKGGQVGDTGTLSASKGIFKVTDCQSPYSDVITHVGKMEKGTLSLKESVKASVDKARREKIACHHTATHLLHWALHKVLGEHIRQAGSVVEEKRLRFDFSHHKALSSEEIRRIEMMVNEKIREDEAVKTYELSYEEVQKRADIKQFFGDKYGTKVRVVDIDYSKELCGGTHIGHVGKIGLFRIAKESSIAAGVRRIEGVVGKAAEEFMYQQEDLGLAASALLKTALVQLPEKVSALVEENKTLQTQLKTYKRASLKGLSKQLATELVHAGSIPLIAASVNVENDELPLLSEDICTQISSCVLVLAIKYPDRCQLFVKVTPDLVQKGIQAVALIKEIAPLVGGSGGGKADTAQAGGKNPQGLEQAFEQAKKFLSAK